MSDAPSARFGDLCRSLSGGTPSKRRPEYWNGEIPWVSPKDMTAEFIDDAEEHINPFAINGSAAKLVPPSTLLVVVRSGILVRCLPVALTCRAVAFNQDIKAFLVNKDRVLPEYAQWWLRSREPLILRQGVKKGATVHSVTAGFIENLRIALPPREEQRRIVDILNHAASIRRLREQAKAKAKELIPALFLDMFGDPARNARGWPIELLGHLGNLDRGRSQHRPRNDPRLLGGPYPFIQTGDVANSGGRIRRYEATYSELGLKQSRMWPRGTLCTTIAANIAKTGVLDFDACFPDSVVGFVPGPRISSSYIQGILDHLQEYLEELAPQLAQKNINLKILRGIKVPVPPLDLQVAFTERVADIQATIDQMERAAEDAEHLQAALMARLFDGTST